jgi:hypothetical protein
MMKAVMREIAQATRHYSKLPLFGFLRTDSIAPRDRLAFVPCMAPFILAFADLNHFVLRDESADDPLQQLVNRRTGEIEPDWACYLDDFTKLGFERSTSLTQALRSSRRDETHHSRMLAARLAQILYAATPVEKLVVLESIEAAGDVMFELTARISIRIHAEGGPELRYFAEHRQRLDSGVFEAIALTQLERVRCLDLAFQVFDMFADWSNELLAFARSSLAQRPVPRLVQPALKSAT